VFHFPIARSKFFKPSLAHPIPRRASEAVHRDVNICRSTISSATSFAREVAEAALAHRVGDMVERAYRRGGALEKRRTLMDAWASFCADADGRVLLFASRK
jgi:hypothetical protein